MKKKAYTRTPLTLLLLIFSLLLIRCQRENKKEEAPEPSTFASCEGCHTNYTHLKEVHSPDSVLPEGGCGGEADYYQPFDRVVMRGDGYEEFKASSHYSIGCTGCHNGDGETAEKELAHSGDFISHPSEDYENKCSGAACHDDKIESYKTSLHNGTGQKRKVAIRSGLSGPDDFDDLPEHQIEGYNKNCAQCHGTCGNCHVVRPPVGGGGLINGHMFNKTPNMTNVCSKCHASRGRHAFYGDGEGTEQDVHKGLGFTCLSCHTGDEMHGNGQPVEQRYAYTELPTCDKTGCHNSEDLATANTYHSMHYEELSCYICHSQDYNNCGDCHVPGEDPEHKSGVGAQYGPYLGYKIARNTIPELRTFVSPRNEKDLVLVRRTLASPQNWDNYETNAYADGFNKLPTYNYTSPHNILRWTTRTKVEEGESCSLNCHLGSNGENKALYLFMEDLLDWEVEATGQYTIDQK